MPNPLTPERRAALRNWAITQQAGLANQPETHGEWHDEWELAQNLLDLLAALETAEARAAEAERGRLAGTPQVGGREAVILYTNWRGETAERRIIPGSIWFGSTEWHRDEQYLLRAWDVEKGAVRDFALRDVREWREGKESSP